MHFDLVRNIISCLNLQYVKKNMSNQSTTKTNSSKDINVPNPKSPYNTESCKRGYFIVKFICFETNQKNIFERKKKTDVASLLLIKVFKT